MFELFAFLAIVILGVLLSDTRTRLKRAEKILAETIGKPGAAQGTAKATVAKAKPAADPQSEATTVIAARAAAKDSAPLPALTQKQGQIASAPGGVDARPSPPPAPESKTPATPPNPAPPANLSARFEDLFGKTLPIWAGGITLAIAGVLIVRYAIDLGFFARVFTPGVQVLAGILFGLALVGAAEYAWRNESRVRDLRVAQALSGAGVATLYAAIMVAANIYGLIGPLLAFFALALVTASALALSLRFGPPSALLGLAGGLAAPALVGALEPNVPLLAVYLSLTIGALTGVARMRGWPWLALAALVGGAGWSAWMILLGGAFDTLGSLSIGGYVLLLGIAIPLLAYDGPRAALLRGAAAIVGALQLALLVAYAGFAPLHWGLFALLAAAGQWLAWRESKLAMVPTTSLALSILLIALWPDPTLFWFSLVGLSLASIHALPLLARLWAPPADLRRTLELCALALALPLVAKWQWWDMPDGALALVALVGGLLLATAIARGWRVEGRAADRRFAWLTGTAAALIALALVLTLPVWLAAVAVAVVAAALLPFGGMAGDRRIEWIAVGFFGAALVGLIATPRALDELPRLASGTEMASAEAFLRWAALTLGALLFAVRAERRVVLCLGQGFAAALAYGAAAQLLPATLLVLVPALGTGALLLAARRFGLGRVGIGAAILAAIALGWAAMPVAFWAGKAALSLAGVPMLIDGGILAVDELVRRLALPALICAVPLWLQRETLPRWLSIGGMAIAGAIGVVAVHTLYRLGFAALVGDDFVATGIAQRLVWETLLIGLGWLLWRRGITIGAQVLVIAGTAHALVYGLVLHNPLWAQQAVGGWPLVNLLAPLFLLPWFGLRLAGKMVSPASARLDRGIQLLTMLLIATFARASLRQLFHGSLLVEAGVAPAENILRSLLILLLAIGFLLWGIRQHHRDWRLASLLLMLGAVGKVFVFDASGLEGLLRIGSFVALGFSLIGIGWLYSRQLRAAGPPPEIDEPGIGGA